MILPPHKKGIIEPNLLKSKFYWKPIKVFVCGPGTSHQNYSIRESVRDYLKKIDNVSVVFGEDLTNPTVRKNIKRSKSDLQTLEYDLAHQVDFTILMLDSPGSIAELGTFSMVSSLRPRLYTLVSDVYFGDESYISRGPLSLLSREHSSNVIYYKFTKLDTIYHRLDWAVTFYKYARNMDPNYITSAFSADNRLRYNKYIQNHYQNFLASAVLISIIILDKPNFAEIVNALKLSPQEISSGLSVLHNNNAIEKQGATYVAINGYEDDFLSLFNSGSISRKKAIFAGIKNFN